MNIHDLHASALSDANYNEDGLVLSSGYEDTMNGAVLPYLRSHRTDEKITRDGCALFTSRFVPDGEPRGTVMIVHGFTENTDKYAEIIHSLLHSGWCVLSYDQRGHGRSWRKPGLKDLSVTHVDRFEDYVKDLGFVVSHLLKAMPAPHMLFCHSMGGAVSALFLESSPDVFEKAVFSSPMIAPNLGGAPAGLVRAVCRVPSALGHGSRRAFISRPYKGPEDFETSCASGRERFDWYEKLRAANPLFQNNGPSYAWAREAIGVTVKILAPDMPERIRIPVRVFGAENDGSVITPMEEAFASRLPSGTFRIIPGSKHEIYRSPDSVLFPWWHEVLHFYAGQKDQGRNA